MVTSTLQQTPLPAASAPLGKRRFRWGPWALVAMIGALLVTWLPQIGLPLGDSHEGRILARLGMQAANVWRLGWTGSGWGTLLAPYDMDGVYAHHPPLINLLHVITVGILGGDQPWHLRVPGYVAGLATLVAVAMLLRVLELGWVPALLAVGAMAATPMFWVYGRLGAGFSVLAGFAALVAHLRRRARPGRGAVVTATVFALLTVLLSWPGALGGALFWVWLWWRRGFDAVSRWVLAGWLAGAVLLGTWLLGSGAGADLITRAGERVAAIDPAGFVERQWWFATELFTWWWLLLLIPALVAGVTDRRTRAPVAITATLGVLWTLVPTDASFIHDFWNLTLLLPVAIGTAALADVIGRRLGRGWTPALAAVGAVALTVALTGVVAGSYPDRYFTAPSQAGALLREMPPPPGLEMVAVGAEMSLPRWASWWWSAPVFVTTPGNAAWLDPATPVLIRPGDWDIDPSSGDVLAVRGDYALVSAGALAGPSR